MNLNTLFEKLWVGYSEMNPGAYRIHELLTSEGEIIVNDHIAFRTFDIPGIDIESLSGIFLDLGYTEKGLYTFEKKKLRAKHYEHISDPLAPKIFISELIVSEFSDRVVKTANDVAGKILKKIKSSEDLVFALNQWQPISYKTYNELLAESEYAAWLYVFGFRANHFTIYINHLKKYTTIEELNNYLKRQGFILNTMGGEIKGTREELLMQSSTVADMVEVSFTEGNYMIPGCYYEFAQRFTDKKGKIYNGFIASSADRIFESTNSR